MLESEFGLNCMKASILLCISASGCWWCNVVGDIFLALFGHVGPADHCLPTWVVTTLYLSSDWSVRQDNTLCHEARIIWTWQWVHCNETASTSSRSQSNTASLGCGETGDCAADISMIASHNYSIFNYNQSILIDFIVITHCFYLHGFDFLH